MGDEEKTDFCFDGFEVGTTKMRECVLNGLQGVIEAQDGAGRGASRGRRRGIGGERIRKVSCRKPARRRGKLWRGKLWRGKARLTEWAGLHHRPLPSLCCTSFPLQGHTTMGQWRKRRRRTRTMKKKKERQRMMQRSTMMRDRRQDQGREAKKGQQQEEEEKQIIGQKIPSILDTAVSGHH